MMPCLNKDSLKLLVGTADERYNYSVEYFRKTHFPQVMHRYHGSQLIAEVTESELFGELKEVDSDGNRVYLIFGSTGSGKSELLCWLKDRWALEVPDRPVIRISRSELNPQVLIKKCLDVLNIPLAVDLDENRWDILLKKPITLINQMVWAALAESMESDEEIVPAALLLRPIIERNIIEFTKQVKRGRIRKPLEILYREQFDELIASTTLKISLEYLSFRQILSRKLDQFLFEDWDIGSLFRIITNQMKNNDLRPLLLIDDLVQSVNIYASDLLDQLITLEEGNWDVVIGLTPGAIRDSDKGFDLTKRIQNLDTIDDRVKKLWLSDESGREYYNLDRKQVIPYMTNYLEQLKNVRGYTCSSECQHYQNCSIILQPTSEQESATPDRNTKLLPFNEHMIQRTFDAIPQGKGKLRYMILNSKEIIRFFLKGNKDYVSRIVPLIKREMFADQSDLLIKTLAEWYVSEKANEVTISKQLLKNFGLRTDEAVVYLNCIDHSSIKEHSTIKTESNETSEQFDRAVIRDWIEGSPVNEELLLPIRLGVSSLIHDSVKSVNMSRPFTPRTTSTIQRNDINRRTRYPITLNGNEKEEGIFVEKGFAALQIANFQSLKYPEKMADFQKISNEYETAMWVYQAEDLHLKWLITLEQILDMKVSTFAFGLKCWVKALQIYSESLWASDVIKYSPLNQELSNLAEQCFQDWYMLRDNLYQPTEANDLMTDEDFKEWILNFNPVKELEHYQIGNVSLYVFLLQLKERSQNYYDLLNGSIKQSIQNRMSMISFLSDSRIDISVQLGMQIQNFNQKTKFTQGDFVSYTLLEKELKSHRLIEQYAKSESLHKEVKQLEKNFYALKRDVKILSSECGIDMDLDLNEGINTVDGSTKWSNLERDKEELISLVDELTRLKSCLSLSPRTLVRQITKENIKIQELVHVQNLMLSMSENINQLFQKQFVGFELLQLIDEWQSIDFQQLKIHITNEVHREQTKSRIIQVLRNDLDCNEISNVYQLLELIDESPQIRPALKRHIKLLVENGHSTLPPVQWRRLLDEIKANFPHLFGAIEIKLVVGNET